MIVQRMLKTGDRFWQRVQRILLQCLSALLFPTIVFAQNADRDIRSWRDPANDSLVIEFSTLLDYLDCPLAGATDEIFVRGLPQNWHLHGQLWLSYVDGEERILVPNGIYPVDFTSPHADGEFALTIMYPPLAEWLKNRAYFNRREVHVDVSIEVMNEFGASVHWIGEDLVNAPGTLGPGGQDWTVSCIAPPVQLFLPAVVRH